MFQFIYSIYFIHDDFRVNKYLDNGGERELEKYTMSQVRISRSYKGGETTGQGSTRGIINFVLQECIRVAQWSGNPYTHTTFFLQPGIHFLKLIASTQVEDFHLKLRTKIIVPRRTTPVTTTCEVYLLINATTSK